MDKENWKKEYEAGKITECPFCGGESLEHTCRNCYLEINKETCWKYERYCQKCFKYIHEEIPRLEKIKQNLGVKCKCVDPNCAKCLLGGCLEDDCPVHTKIEKEKRRRNKGLK